MPRTATTTSLSPSPSKPYASSGWSRAQKLALFSHVVKHGETGWADAVEGKTAKQSRDQWQKTLLPHILRTSF
ncbi:hypothetical protein Q5752_005004 [Cryptotrichosporon argae]